MPWKIHLPAFNRLDVVVNNAGYGIGGSLEELTDEEVRKSFDVNVFAVFNVIRKALPYLRDQRSGHIINISSIAGLQAAPDGSLFSRQTCGDRFVGSYWRTM